MSIDPYVVDVLMPDLVGHDRHPSAFLTYLFLARHANEDSQEWSLREIADATGLSKRAVQGGLSRLVARGLIAVDRPTITAVGRYRVNRPWAARR